VLINRNRNTVIAGKKKLLSSLFSKAKGLMFTSSSAVRDKAMVLVFKKEKTVSLHMFFVFYPIDVIFLDQTKKVIEIKMNFKPFTFQRIRHSMLLNVVSAL
jgi:uncharacterized protein